jgi:hypothetical protein
MASVFTPDILQTILYSVNTEVINRRKPIALDRKNMPWMSVLQKRKGTTGLAGANGPIVKWKVRGGLDLQGWQRKDTLTFAESNIELQGQFPYSNIHMGLELVHDDLESMGYVVLPNQPRGRNFAKPVSEDEANRLVDILYEKVEDLYDSYDVQFDLMMLTDNSSNPKLIQGLDAFMPVANTAGTIGGVNRSNPVVQHYVEAGATYGASGTLSAAMTRGRRVGNLNSRGRTVGNKGIDFIMAGAGALDRFVSYARANALQIWTDAKGTPNLDIGIPDHALHFEGIPFIHNPSFELMDTLYPGNANPWTNRIYMLNSQTWKMATAPGKDKFFSAPMDPSDTRLTRLSLDSKGVLLPLVPNANSLITVAA